MAHNMRMLDLVLTTLKIEFKFVVRFDRTELTSTKEINETLNKIRLFF